MTEAPPFYLRVSVARQVLELIREGQVRSTYPVSTARNGVGERIGSGCTPRGWHAIRARIGRDAPMSTVFVGRRPTGEIYDAVLAAQYPERDWILTRILWLGGLEPGLNRFGDVDTATRYIYIHGSPDHGVTGSAESHGCIRMKNADIWDLFEQVEAGTRVYIGA